MDRLSYVWVTVLLCAASAPGCGLVLDTQARDDGGSDAGTGQLDTGLSECSTPRECDDGNVCNGAEGCVEGRCVGTGVVMDCADGVSCTEDQCDPAMGCINVPRDATCGPRSYCDPLEDCQPLPSCERPEDCAPRDPCNGPMECVDSVCVQQVPVVCPLQGECLVGQCVAGNCLYAPSRALCASPVTGCAVSECGSNGRCTQAIPDDERCDDGIACTDDVCAYAGQTAAQCQHIPNHDRCEDGVPCTLNACAPNDPTATVPGSGCAIRLNDDVCGDVSDQTECTRQVCLPTGCEDGVQVRRCLQGGACIASTGECEVVTPCPNNCSSVGSPCAPAVCLAGQCVTLSSDPCISAVVGSIGYCDISGPVPRCGLRIDSSLLPLLSLIPLPLP